MASKGTKSRTAAGRIRKHKRELKEFRESGRVVKSRSPSERIATAGAIGAGFGAFGRKRKKGRVKTKGQR